jgi:predicted aspartyl protease
MKTYKLEKIGRLLFTKGAVKGEEGVFHFKLLVDTGSTYTILPWEYLSTAGVISLPSVGRAQIITASGTIFAPKVKVGWFSCLGLSYKSFPVVAHTLPLDLSEFGILGMDFLRKAQAKIDVPKSRIHIQS